MQMASFTNPVAVTWNTFSLWCFLITYVFFFLADSCVPRVYFTQPLLSLSAVAWFTCSHVALIKLHYSVLSTVFSLYLTCVGTYRVKYHFLSHPLTARRSSPRREEGQLHGTAGLWWEPEVTLCLLEIQSVFHHCRLTLKFVGTSALCVKTPPGTIITPVSAVYFGKNNDIFPPLFSLSKLFPHIWSPVTSVAWWVSVLPSDWSELYSLYFFSLI